MPRILHIALPEKFMNNYVDLLCNNGMYKDSKIYYLSDDSNYPVKESAIKQTVLKKNIFSKGIFSLLLELNRTDKIIVHGLFSFLFIMILFVQPWLLKKIYWVVWGRDLYTYKIDKRTAKWNVKEFFRKRVIKRIPFILTYIPGDFELVKKWYGSKGIMMECLMYPSNTVKDIRNRSNFKCMDNLNIIVGNSADPSNNHEDIFLKLLKVNDVKFNIICPLSYGDTIYADKVEALGLKYFGSRFTSLRKMISLDEYNKMLDKIDIAIYAHDRQQAMGNIINLLGIGKKVYIKSNISTYDLFDRKDIYVFDFDSLHLDMKRLEPGIMKSNIENVNKLFSEENLIKQWKKVLEL